MVVSTGLRTRSPQVDVQRFGSYPERRPLFVELHAVTLGGGDASVELRIDGGCGRFAVGTQYRFRDHCPFSFCLRRWQASW